MITPALPPAPRRALAACVRALAACVVAPMLTAAAHAQSPAAPRAGALDPVVVTAARTAQPIADVLADITVISGEESAAAACKA